MSDAAAAGLNLTSTPGALHDGDDLIVDISPVMPIIGDISRVPEAMRRGLAVVGDMRWDLSPLVQKKTLTETVSINFDTFPPAYRETAKRLIWSYINLATPIADLDRATATRSRLSPTTIANAAVHLRKWMTWLAARNIVQFADVNDRDFDNYCDELCASGADRAVTGYRLFAVTRAWLYAPYLPAADRLMRPTWERGTQGRADVLGPANWSSENKTQPIHPQTMSALLVWALRFVEDFSVDILNAKSMKSTPRQIDPQLQTLSPPQRFRSYLNQRRESSQHAPGIILPRQPGRRCLAKAFIGWELGLTAEQVARIGIPDLPTRQLDNSEEPNLPLTITATVNGEQKWIDAINFYDVEEWSRYLATAAFIVIAYLTGMRSEECRALERGCCQTRINTSTGQATHIIRGKTFKSALDASGNTQPGGAEREDPWLAIAPVAKAVAVMEALHPHSDLIFPMEAFSGTPALSRPRVAANPRIIRDRVAAFILCSNEIALRLERSTERIFRKLSVCCGSVCCCGTTRDRDRLATVLGRAA